MNYNTQKQKWQRSGHMGRLILGSQTVIYFLNHVWIIAPWHYNGKKSLHHNPIFDFSNFCQSTLLRYNWYTKLYPLDKFTYMSLNIYKYSLYYHCHEGISVFYFQMHCLCPVILLLCDCLSVFDKKAWHETCSEYIYHT